MGSLEFHQPATLEEALDLLGRYGEDARIVAGSTAVTIMLRQRLIAPAALIGIGRLPGLSDIRSVDGRLELGALVTHRRVERDPIVGETLPVVADTFGEIANVRVRNVATVGGVVAEADYASDPPALFVALDATIQATAPDGRRDIPAATFFEGFYQTSLAPNEIVTAVHVPRLSPGTAAVYLKYRSRSSEDRPCVGVAAVVRLADGGETVEEARVAVGAAADVPQRFDDVEKGLAGLSPVAAAVAAAEAYADRIEPIEDLRGSAWYRREMIRVWVRRAVMAATESARTAAEVDGRTSSGLGIARSHGSA